MDVDSDSDAGYGTDLTEMNEDADEDGDSDGYHDISDLAELFTDNEHPPEHYIQQLKNFDGTAYTKEDYRRAVIFSRQASA